MSQDNEKWNSSYVSVTSPDGTQNLDNVSPFSITGPDRRDVAAAIEDAPSISVTRPDQYQTVHNLLNKEEPTPHFQNSGFSPQNQSFQSAGREESGTSRRSVGFADQVRGGVEIAFPSRIDFWTEGEHGGFWARCRATIFSFAVVGMVFYGVYRGGFWAYHLFQQFSFSSKKEASLPPPPHPQAQFTVPALTSPKEVKPEVKTDSHKITESPFIKTYENVIFATGTATIKNNYLVIPLLIKNKGDDRVIRIDFGETLIIGEYGQQLKPFRLEFKDGTEVKKPLEYLNGVLHKLQLVFSLDSLNIKRLQTFRLAVRFSGYNYSSFFHFPSLGIENNREQTAVKNQSSGLILPSKKKEVAPSPLNELASIDIQQQQDVGQQTNTLIAEANGHFKKGKMLLAAGKNDEAKKQFDNAVDAILSAPQEIRDQSEVQALYFELTNKINLMQTGQQLEKRPPSWRYLPPNENKLKRNF